MKEELRSAIAGFTAVEPSAVGDGFRFSGEKFQGSVGIYKFMAYAQKRLGRRVPAFPHGASMNDVLALMGAAPGTVAAGGTHVDSGHSADARSTEGSAPEPQAGQVGIDIEAISSMPVAEDYRTHEFYAATFTPREISYCVLKPEPVIHFCGLFSAKEALKKASPGFLELLPIEIEVGHDQHGRPMYKRAGTVVSPGFALSISHTRENAVAVAMKSIQTAAPAPVSLAVPAVPEMPSGETVPRGQGLNAAVLLTILLLCLVVGALFAVLSKRF